MNKFIVFKVNAKIYFYFLVLDVDMMEKKLVLLSSVAAVSTGVAAWALYKWLQTRETLNTYTDIYSNMKEVYKQVFHHFGNLQNLPHLRNVIPTEAENYQLRLAEYCREMCDKYEVKKDRVLDVGCGPGGAAFYLSSHFREVVATDTSVMMIIIGKTLQQFGRSECVFLNEGGKHITPLNANVPESALKERVAFWDEDVCSLYHTCGKFGCVLVSNTLTEMHDPQSFLKDIGAYVPPGGLLIISDVYDWRDGPEEVLGGDGSCLTYSIVKKLLQPTWTFEEEANMLYFVPCCARLAQLGNAHVTVWRRKDTTFPE